VRNIPRWGEDNPECGDRDDCCTGNEQFVGHFTVCFLPPLPAGIISLCIGYPAGMAWYFSMKVRAIDCSFSACFSTLLRQQFVVWLPLQVAVVLSLDDVTNVMKTTTKSALLDDGTWSTNVARPTIRLATETMPNLSRGWGTGTGFTAVLFAIITILNFIGVVHDIRIGAKSTSILRRTGGVVGGAISPFLLAIDAAHVSSRCDHLLKSINSLRLEWASTETAKAVHARVYPLQVTLNELNHGQGLGFTIFTKVRRSGRQYYALNNLSPVHHSRTMPGRCL